MTLEQVLNTEISLQQITQWISSVHPVIWATIWCFLIFCKASNFLRQKNLDAFEFYVLFLASPVIVFPYLIYKALKSPIQKLNDFVDPTGENLRRDIRLGKKICYKCKKFHKVFSNADAYGVGDGYVPPTDCERTFPKS